MSKQTDEIKPLVEQHDKELQDFEWAVELTHSLVQTAQIYVTHYNKQYEELHINHPGLPILFELLQCGGKTSQKRLMQRMSVTKQALAAALKTLEKRGLILRNTLKQDRRKRQVQLTDKGISLLKVIMPIRKNYYTKFLKHISEEDARSLITGLKKVHGFYQRELRKLNKSRNKTLQQP